jgi:hypothetical protein
VVASCTICGRTLEDHDPNVRFQLPDPVLALPERELTPGTWMSHEDPTTSVMMQVPGAGAFVRVLLTVSLAGGSTVTYGLWLGVSPDDLRHAAEQWWAPTYPSLVLEGRVANDVQPWGLLGRHARAVVRDPDQTPYLDSSDDPELQRVLEMEWDHDEVMLALR